MENRKKISDIYREKLHDVETTPPADSWDNISAALDKKDRKRAFLPLWFKIAGSAAVLAVLFGLFYSSFPTFESSNAPAVVEMPVEERSYEFDPVSPYFEETMLRSSILLEVLMNEKTEISSEKTAIRFQEVFQDRDSAVNTVAEVGRQGIISRNSGLSFSAPEIATQNALFEEPEEPSEVIVGNEISETLAENEVAEEMSDKNALSRRFSVTTTAAAVYFDNFGSGNALNAQFGGKESRGEISMAYGVNLAYQLSEKVKIRTGVNKVSLNQNTSNMEYATAMEAASFAEDPLNIATSATGNLEQNMGFVEIPMEMEYSLINRKFGLNLIGGASALFLEENSVSLNSPYASRSLGKATNLNNLSFSANFGLGLNYNISQEFQLNLEPVFKYQLNTFSDVPGLNPYYFGIYSGLRYKF